MAIIKEQLDELKKLWAEKIPFLPFQPVDEKDLEYARKFFDSYPALIEAAEENERLKQAIRWAGDGLLGKEDPYHAQTLWSACQCELEEDRLTSLDKKHAQLLLDVLNTK